MADGEWPKITGRRTTKISPGMTVIERAVEFTPGAAPELYHAVAQQDYIAIVAMTPERTIPIVRQYRPALEAFTWELPAGLVDAGEEPAATCARELQEETGLAARRVHALGTYAPCTARLSNRVHSFFVETGSVAGAAGTEPGIDVRLVTLPDLGKLVTSGDLTLQLHLGALLLAGLAGHIDLSELGAALPATRGV